MLGEEQSSLTTSLAAFRDQFTVEQTSVAVQEAQRDRIAVLWVDEGQLGD